MTHSSTNFSVFHRILFTLFVLASVTSIRTDFKEDPSINLVYFTVIGTVISGFLLSFFTKFPLWIKGIILTLLLALPLGAKFEFSEFEVLYSPTFYLLIVAGIIVFILSSLIDQRKKNIWFLTPEQIQELALVGISFVVFLLYFFASSFGIILFSFLFFSLAINSKNTKWLGVSISLLVLALLSIYFQRYEKLEVSFFSAVFWAGIIAGVALMNFIRFGKNSIVSILISLIVILLFFVFGLKVQIFQSVLFLLGAIFGAGISILVRKDWYENQLTGLVFPLLLALLFPLFNEFQDAQKKTITSPLVQKETNSTDKQVVLADLSPIALTEKQSGLWKSDQEKSLIRFQLGPKGSRTDGAILRFETNLEVNKTGLPSKLSVLMEANSLTTLDQARDASVLGDGYIKANKFEKISFTATTFTKTTNGYLAQGTLDFVGKKANIAVELKFSELDTYPNQLILTGTSNVDRTKHTMSSDAKIGDLVDVSFEIVLKK